MEMWKPALRLYPQFPHTPKIKFELLYARFGLICAWLALRSGASNVTQDQIQIYLDFKISVSELAGSGFDID